MEHSRSLSLSLFFHTQISLFSTTMPHSSLLSTPQMVCSDGGSNSPALWLTSQRGGGGGREECENENVVDESRLLTILYLCELCKERFELTITPTRVLSIFNCTKFTKRENRKSRYNRKPLNQINPACACKDTIVVYDSLSLFFSQLPMRRKLVQHMRWGWYYWKVTLFASNTARRATTFA